MRLRRLRLALATLAGLPRGFFIPYRHAGAARPAGYPALEPLFRAAEPAFLATLAAIEGCEAGLLAIAAQGGVGQAAPRFDQDWFPRLDAAAAYALVRAHRPRRIVEVGSGHSTRFLARAARDGGYDADILCIDPAPRAALPAGVRHEPRLLPSDTAGLLEGFAPGDLLFIDSSHVAMPGTDVDRLFLDALPRLPAGALIHLHDIVLPEAYPEAWAWRGYNEALPVACLLQGGGYEMLHASHWLVTRRPDLLGGILARLPLAPGALEGSLWLRKR